MGFFGENPNFDVDRFELEYSKMHHFIYSILYDFKELAYLYQSRRI